MILQDSARFIKMDQDHAKTTDHVCQGQNSLLARSCKHMHLAKTQQVVLQELFFG